MFFFSSSGDHRDLHSFPTRRSSDLFSCLMSRLLSLSSPSRVSPSAAKPFSRRMFSMERAVPEEPTARSMENIRSEEHTSELQSRQYLVCRLLLEKKKDKHKHNDNTL